MLGYSLLIIIILLLLLLIIITSLLLLLFQNSMAKVNVRKELLPRIHVKKYLVLLGPNCKVWDLSLESEAWHSDGRFIRPWALPSQ